MFFYVKHLFGQKNSYVSTNNSICVHINYIENTHTHTCTYTHAYAYVIFHGHVGVSGHT